MTRAAMDDLDIIRISHVRMECVVGIYDFERVKTQPLVVAVEMYVPRDVMQRAAQSESIADTVDYAKVRDDVTRILVDGQFQLIETAAEKIAAHVLGGSMGGPQVERVRVRVEKPEAIAPALAAVEILR